ncbi:hypothetical protein LUZ60_014498 [Juncus effusus]|nr:hypothetical protein LUZ60_014498 [Juncus effusus]
MEPVQAMGGGDTPETVSSEFPEAAAIEQHLPSTVLATILSYLDIRSIVSASAACRALRDSAASTLSFLPAFHLLEFGLDVDFLRRLLPPNSSLRSVRLDCSRLDDLAIPYLVRPSLSELYLLNCANLSGRILSDLGANCRDLRTLSLYSLSESRGVEISFSNLEDLLNGCSQLESLSMALDFSVFNDPKFNQIWSLASQKLNSLEIGYIPITMLLDLLTTVSKPQITKTPFFPSLQQLILSVDYITDQLVYSISNALPFLTHLDLQDAPIVEPSPFSDLTNTGLQQINKHGKLTHISLIRSQEFLYTSFKRVNDLGFLMMADTCKKLESISLTGFSRVTDAGFRAIIHSCLGLRKLRVSHGNNLTDLVFHDISATSLSLTHVSLRWCKLLTDLGIKRLSFNKDLNVLDLRDCRSLGDEALNALSNLPELQVLLLDNTDISDQGISYLGLGSSPLVTLSLRGCKKLTNSCIPSLLIGSIKSTLQSLDLSRVPNITDEGILSLARTRVPLTELRLRECTKIGDISIMALASMQFEGEIYGSSIRLLDMFECGGITPLAFRWFKKPYFPRLRWLGVKGCLNRDMVDALARSRKFLGVKCRGEEIGTVEGGDGWCDWGGEEEEEDVDELEGLIIGYDEDDGLMDD